MPTELVEIDAAFESSSIPVATGLLEKVTVDGFCEGFVNVL